MNRRISVTNANGKAPIKTSLRDILSSLIVDLITKQEIPKGGVSNPISAPTTVTMQEQYYFQLYDHNIHYRYLAANGPRYQERSVETEHQNILEATLDRDAKKGHWCFDRSLPKNW